MLRSFPELIDGVPIPLVPPVASANDKTTAMVA